MREYSSEISLIKNGRGVYCIDTIMGCKSGMENEMGGCYNDCYAARTAKRYGHDFTKSILRKFESERHRRQIISEIAKIKMPFIRIGCSGDPSENWQHTIDVIKTLSRCEKEIVIITRHWNLLTDEQLNYFSTINICINTSVSALDKLEIRERSIEQYNRIKNYCKSVLRIVSCNFNEDNFMGKVFAEIQRKLFKNENIIDTVFRPSKSNPLVKNEVIHVTKAMFNGGKQLMSKFNKNTFTGKCIACKEMCGASMIKNSHELYPNKRRLTKQQTLFP